MHINALEELISDYLSGFVSEKTIARDELTIVIPREHLLHCMQVLRDANHLAFDMLLDVCGVDYLLYGIDEWQTYSATATGFERGVERQAIPKRDTPRFGVVYHLLSIKHNHRVRVKVLLEEADLYLPSVINLWPSANWFEREAFDLFGIIFSGHPDLRRLLTDYGFIGHPFRKDFPLIGEVEARYDAHAKRVVYEPVSIEPRVLEPKVIRRDNRYEVGE